MINAKHDKARHVLILTADNEARSALKEAYQRGGYQRAEGLIAEAFHEAYEFVDPGYVPGAMTDAPILVDCDWIDRPDNGAMVILESANIFWFPGYMITDPFEQLKNTGRVEFEEATPYSTEIKATLPRDLDDYLSGGKKEGYAVWIGEAVFQNEKAVPEVVEYNRPNPGFYFWRHGEKFGPFSSGAIGAIELERCGGAFYDSRHDPNQLIMI